MKTILVVEDEGPILRMLRLLLEDEGYLVETARDGAEGLAKAASVVPDLIISDVMMPRMTGTDLARSLGADPALRAIPVILMSAARLPGPPPLDVAFLPKPFELDELLALVAGRVRG